MLNEEKIQAMTDLAVFEKHQGRKIFPVNQFFKSDYVGGQLFRSFFGYTFSFVLILLMWIMYKLGVIIKGAAIETVVSWAKNWGLGYITGLVFYLLITWKIYSKRYDFASRSQTMYMARLKHLERNSGKTTEKETEEEPLYDRSFAVKRAPERIL